MDKVFIILCDEGRTCENCTTRCGIFLFVHFPNFDYGSWTVEVWRSYITPKNSFILWLGAQSKLLTKDRLMHLDIDRTCILCWSQVKTCQHLFFQCAITSCIWHVIRKWLGIRRSMTTLPSTLKWMKKEAQGTSWQSKAKKIALAHTVYQT